jgi:CNT family concentrative nucleoside transporter
MIQGSLGLLAFIGIAWLLSENKKNISIRMVAVGLGIQILLGVLLLKLDFFRDLFIWLNNVVLALEESTQAGTSFVFGYLGGGTLPFAEKFPGAGYILAFRGLPLVLVMSALSSLLFYWKILPLVVKGFSKILQKSMRIGGAEGLCVSANIFVGMVESPCLFAHI